MVVPVLLCLMSAVAVAVTLLVPGWSDLVLLAGSAALASLYLVLRARFGRQAAKPKPIMIDGSNVLYWRDGTPQIDGLREVVGHLKARGYGPHVVFDANAGYLVAGKYQHDRAMGTLLGLPEDRVIVVSKGSPADPVLLAAARDLGARIVTNDRYREWAEAHPEVNTPGHLIKGGFRDTGLWLDLEAGVM